MLKQQLDDIIILVPGILGSVLQRNGKDVWAPNPKAVVDALRTLAFNIKDLAIDQDPVEEDELGDGVKATRLVQDVHIIPGFTAVDGYTGIREFLFEQFDLTEGQNYFEFAYDWRRDNRVAARKLKYFAEQALAQARNTKPSARLILLAHSMGGLVSQFYLECLDGAKDTRILITLGTPFRGSLKALDFIAHGFKKNVGPVNWLDLSTLLRSMTSVYQLLPRYPCVHVGDEVLRPAEVQSIPNLDGKRARQALDEFHSVLDKAIDQRINVGYSLYPIIGIGQPTLGSANLFNNAELVLQYGRQQADGNFTKEAGDGTVPRVAAMPIGFKQESPCYYTYAKHSGLQNAVSVQAQILGILTGIRDLDDMRSFNSGLSLDLDDIFSTDEPVVIRVGAAQPQLQLIATITDLASGSVIMDSLVFQSEKLLHTLQIARLPPGSYRVHVSGEGRSSDLVNSVTEVFVVLDQQDPPSNLS